jgi:hypothetical protein
VDLLFAQKQELRRRFRCFRCHENGARRTANLGESTLPLRDSHYAKQTSPTRDSCGDKAEAFVVAPRGSSIDDRVGYAARLLL